MRGTDPLERQSFLVGKAIESHKLGSLEIKNMNACVQEVGITTFSAVVISLINHRRKKIRTQVQTQYALCPVC